MWGEERVVHPLCLLRENCRVNVVVGLFNLAWDGEHAYDVGGLGLQDELLAEFRRLGEEREKCVVVLILSLGLLK